MKSKIEMKMPTAKLTMNTSTVRLSVCWRVGQETFFSSDHDSSRYRRKRWITWVMPSSLGTDVGGDGRRGRTRTDNHWFWRPELCQIELRASAGSLLRLPVEGMSTVTRTILPKLEPARIVLLVLARGVR